MAGDVSGGGAMGQVVEQQGRWWDDVAGGR